jgi:hypothetical protein
VWSDPDASFPSLYGSYLSLYPLRRDFVTGNCLKMKRRWYRHPLFSGNDAEIEERLVQLQSKSPRCHSEHFVSF